RAYRQVLETDAKNADAIHRLGQLLTKKMDYPGAIRLFRKLTGLRPDLYKPWLCRADCYERVGRDLDALNAYREIVLINPELPEVFARMALLLGRLGRLKDVNMALAAAGLNGTPAPSHVQSTLFDQGRKW